MQANLLQLPFDEPLDEEDSSDFLQIEKIDNVPFRPLKNT